MNKRQDLIQAAKFLGFSVSAGVIEAAVFAILDNVTGWSYWPCYLIALTASVVWNFTFNRKFTFKDAGNVPVAMLKVALFYAVFTPISTIGGDMLEKAGWNEYLILGLTMLINLTSEFIYDKFVVFKNPKPDEQ